MPTSLLFLVCSFTASGSIIAFVKLTGYTSRQVNHFFLKDTVSDLPSMGKNDREKSVFLDIHLINSLIASMPEVLLDLVCSVLRGHSYANQNICPTTEGTHEDCQHF